VLRCAATSDDLMRRNPFHVNCVIVFSAPSYKSLLSTIDFVCLSCSFKLIILLCFSMESSHIFGRQFSMWHSTKCCSSIFDLGPLTPKIYSQNLHKIAYKSACMADRPEMFGPTRGFSEMADSMEPCKMLWADPCYPCCHGNDIWARRGDPVAYRLVSVFLGRPCTVVTGGLIKCS